LTKIFTTPVTFWIYLSTIVAIVIIPLNTGEINNITILRFRGDYIVHALLFLPWAFFLPVFHTNKWLWLFFGLLFAAGSEGLQYFLPYRAWNVNDLLANSLGVCLGFGVFLLMNANRTNS
jgi:glycopeptide antibiotics resistance protein